MDNQEINPLFFAKDRATEIQHMESAIETSRKKSMMFQRLPFYLRRRPRSSGDVARKKRHRKRDRHALRTHTWYAKRFAMIKVWGASLPLKRRMKSDKFIYRSQHRGFVFDESYKKIVVYHRPGGVAGVSMDHENVVQRLWHNESVVEVILTREFLVAISLGDVELRDVDGRLLEEHSRIGCCLSVLKADALFGERAGGEYSKVLLELGRGSLNELLKGDFIIPVRSLSESESGKILLGRTRAMDFWQKLVTAGIIPVGIEELQRIALENDWMLYPFDSVHTSAYGEYERALVEPLRAKYERTPRGKRTRIDVGQLYLHTGRRVKYAIFEMRKGCVERCAFIHNSSGEEVGRVIRCAFSFTRGCAKGLCCLHEEAGGELHARSTISPRAYGILLSSTALN
jgi:hypothetical protein